jgi:pimeloyl-ACP methyl ester carboxylesterase
MEQSSLDIIGYKNQLEQIHPRSLFIIGTADKYYPPDILKHLEGVTRGRSVVIDGANHGLEIPDDISKSLRALEQIVLAMQAFLNEGGRL